MFLFFVFWQFKRIIEFEIKKKVPKFHNNAKFYRKIRKRLAQIEFSYYLIALSYGMVHFSSYETMGHS
jgi:hypothetical protein